MSTALISRSDDLTRLRDEGYELEIRDDHLLVHHVPYVNVEGEVAYGTLVSTLMCSGDVTARPETHAIDFIGETPCDNNGKPLDKIIINTGERPVTQSIVVNLQFSSKPAQPFPDYYAKLTSYVRILGGYAHAIDSTATARTYRPIVETEDDGVFEYVETQSSRAGIRAATDKLRLGRLAIVGLGGTGSYVLDQGAKTPVREIHLFDGDRFLHHNAFRAPGAPSIDELRAGQMKVDYFKGIYSRMHRNVHAHAYYVDESNLDELREMDFVFICVDRGESRKLIADRLTEWGIPFIDVGLGVEERDGSLGGSVRTTTGTPSKHDHLARRLPIASTETEDDYRKNIQVADLNALNAVLAVVKWKKLMGFYADTEGEHQSIYTITGNTIINEDTA